MRSRLVSGAAWLIALALCAAIIVVGDDGLRAVGTTPRVAKWGPFVLLVLVLAAARFVAGIVRAATAPLPLDEILDTSEAHERAIIEVGDPGQIALQTMPLLWDRTRWVIRRVEQIALTDRTMVRRRVSVDFRMPQPVVLTIDDTGSLSDEALELLAAGPWEAPQAVPRPAFVPITILRGWPPVLKLDLRNEAGAPLSLLSKAATNALDSALLMALARSAYGVWADQLEHNAAQLVHEDGVAALAHYTAFMHGAARARRNHANDIDEEAAGRTEELARVLVHNTLLWVPATEHVGRRTIVKFAYDEPIRRHLGSTIRSLLATVNLRGVVANFEVGQIGDAASYHLEIDIPAPLELLSADLVIADANAEPPETLRQRVAARWARTRERSRRRWEVFRSGIVRRTAILLGRAPVEVVDRGNHSQVFTRRAHLYASGQPSRTALATLRMVPERRGTPLAGAMTGVLVAATLIALTELAGPVFDHKDQSGLIGAVLAFLLLAPTLVSYVVSRGAEHPAAARALAGVRLLTVASVLVSIVTGGVLVWSIAKDDRHALTHGALVLRDVAVVVAAVLVAGLALPVGRRWRRQD